MYQCPQADLKETLEMLSIYPIPQAEIEFSASSLAEQSTRWARQFFDDLYVAAGCLPPEHHLEYVPPIHISIHDKEYARYL